MKSPFNKYLYIGFIALGIYQAFFSDDFFQGVASIGIAFAFDPFDPEVEWKDRPMWQKVVLYAHLALCAALLGFGLGWGDR